MKKQILLTAIATLLTTQVYAGANHRYHGKRYSSCVQEYYTLINTKFELGENCVETEKMQLMTVHRNYPNLRHNPRRVKIWLGSFERDLMITTKHLRELVDECRGKIISSTEVMSFRKTALEFSVRNPNLDRDISESYMLVPMTDEEAKEEMAFAENKCLNHKIK